MTGEARPEFSQSCLLPLTTSYNWWLEASENNYTAGVPEQGREEKKDFRPQLVKEMDNDKRQP